MASIELSTESPLEKHGYLFGKKIKKSLSPELHALVYQELGLRWAQHRLDSDDIPGFLQLSKHPNFFGASVTMPNKVAIMPHLDFLTDEGRSVGACNTVFVREDENGRRLLCGTNTDTVGVRDAFYNNLTTDSEDAFFHGRPGLVIGGGGAARSAVYALRHCMRVTDIYLVNRDAREIEAVISWWNTTHKENANGERDGRIIHVTSIEQAEALPAPGAVVACVPDFPPQTPEEILARRIFEAMMRKEEKGAVLEMCYNPTPWTEIGHIAEREGWDVILGTEAMIWQGIEQDKYWTGKEAHELPIRKIRDMVASKLPQRPKGLVQARL